MKELRIKNKGLRLIEGNIALVDAEAVVNAANKSLILGGGVAGAIRSFGGPSIQEECNSIGPIEVGEAVITGAGNTLNSLKCAKKKKIRSIVFPAISAGIFRFPIKRCSEIMIRVCLDFMKKNEHPEEIILCLYGDRSYSVFETTLNHIEKSLNDPD